jgi:hypothetical protein
VLALRCGDGVIRVDASLADMSRPRVHIGAFTVEAPLAATLPTLLTIERTTAVEGQVVEGPLGRCVVQLDGTHLKVEVADGPFLGELVLRLAWYVVTGRLGGLLIHASALALGDVALVACGKSGDGKSTLSRLGVGAGLRLLTDEIVQLFPDGRVGGTPFRSDFDNVGSPGLVRARYFVTLSKAQREALEPLAALEAGSVALAQCFDVDAFTLPRVELRRRVLAFLSNVELRTLAFRKDPAAGGFVRAALQP